MTVPEIVDSNQEGEWEISGAEGAFTFWHGPIEGLILIETEIHVDPTGRGYFRETYRQNVFEKFGIQSELVQASHSMSHPNVLRGLHLQNPHGQGKLVRVSAGAVQDVAVDVRTNSPTYGKWVSVVLSAENHLQFYVPPAFLHGFCVLGDQDAHFLYSVTDYYNKASEKSVIWNDDDLRIPWQVSEPLMTISDTTAQTLAQYSQSLK